MDKDHAGELEDLDDIDSELDDEWAKTVNGKKPVVKKMVIKVKKALGGGDYPGNMPKQLARGLCKKFGGDPGFFTRCAASDLRLPAGYDKKAYCAELHKHCTGHWPAEKKARSTGKRGCGKCGKKIRITTKKTVRRPSR